MDKHYGAGIDQYWMCCRCRERFQLRNCELIRSVVQRGKGRSRLQPALNLELAMGARVNGINHEKLIGFLQGSVGIKTMTRRNQKYIDLKICGAISQLYEKRQEENLKEHIKACQQVPDYEPIYFLYDGEWCQATPGPAAMDGCGVQRCYDHKVKSSETALIVQSGVVCVPIALVHSQVSTFYFFVCIWFTLTWNNLSTTSFEE